MKKLLNDWIKEAKSPQKVTLWGNEFIFSPPLCEKIDGDGQQLIWVQSIANRPFYWLVLIYSKTDIEDDDFEIDDIINTIKEEFGEYMDERIYSYCKLSL